MVLGEAVPKTLEDGDHLLTFQVDLDLFHTGQGKAPGHDIVGSARFEFSGDGLQVGVHDRSIGSAQRVGAWCVKARILGHVKHGESSAWRAFCCRFCCRQAHKAQRVSSL